MNKIAKHFYASDYKLDDIEEKRKIIYDIISKRLDYKVNRVDCYRNKDIKEIYRLYDIYFFESNLFRYMEEKEKEGWVFKFLIRIIRNDIAGAATYLETKHRTIKSVIFKNTLKETFKADKKVNIGYACYDRLECLLRIIEHEMIHLFMFFFDRETAIKDPHGKEFKKLNGNIFKVFSQYNMFDEDVHIYRGRTIKIRKTLKVGEFAYIRFRNGVYKKVKILELPSIEDLELDEDLTATVLLNEEKKRYSMARFKSPDKKTYKSKNNTILSPISMK